MRTGCVGAVLGFALAVALFSWSEARLGRAVDWTTILGDAVAAGRSVVLGVPTPTPSASRTDGQSSSTRGVIPPSPTSSPARASADGTKVWVTLADLDGRLRASFSTGPVVLRETRARLTPPDRVNVGGRLSLAVVTVPVEIEAKLTVDDRGAVRVTTTRVEAIGATLPADILSTLGKQIDDEGSRAVAAALPAGSKARKVAVESERIVVDLAPRG
ncbi:MAG: hypothetical protein EPO26_02090 [Chloroflexota bacterium]|nr:MAG: hypothetical protein EPO26_02090 [Chloroflexota bacterium]